MKVSALIAVLKAYEQWEADLILCPEAWEGEAGMPTLTHELYDRLIEIQTMRNQALKAVEPKDIRINQEAK
jgi:hypothetical protein